MADFYDDHRAVLASSKTYSKVINDIKNAWHDAFGEELVVKGNAPRARFESMLHELRQRWSKKADRKHLLDVLDIEGDANSALTVEEAVWTVAADEVLRDVDDLTPNQIFSAMQLTAHENGSDESQIEMGLDDFLRAVVRRVFEDNEIKGRINIGPNRHFPRLYQWLVEFASGTDWEDGTGLKIRNLSGRGRVAQSPTDPKLLKVVINRPFL